MMYRLSKYILYRKKFKNTVLQHSLGPDIIHLNYFGSITLTTLSLLNDHDFRSPLILILI